MLVRKRNREVERESDGVGKTPDIVLDEILRPRRTRPQDDKHPDNTEIEDGIAERDRKSAQPGMAVPPREGKPKRAV